MNIMSSSVGTFKSDVSSPTCPPGEQMLLCAAPRCFPVLCRQGQGDRLPGSPRHSPILAKLLPHKFHQEVVHLLIPHHLRIGGGHTGILLGRCLHIVKRVSHSFLGRKLRGSGSRRSRGVDVGHDLSHASLSNAGGLAGDRSEGVPLRSLFSLDE